MEGWWSPKGKRFDPSVHSTVEVFPADSRLQALLGRTAEVLAQVRGLGQRRPHRGSRE